MSLQRRVTVVMLTFNRRDEALTTLARLIALPGAPSVVAVDNGSSDGTALAIAAHFPQVRLVRLDRNLGAAGRNHGVARVRTPYVAFSDDDTRWEPGALDHAADLLDADPALAVISAHVLVGPHRRDDAACVPMARSPLGDYGTHGRRILGFMAGACVMRVGAFRAAGGYSERLFIGAEEMLLALDLAERGAIMAYCPQVVTWHDPSPVRDATGRRWLLARNAIWIAWMRMPACWAWRLTWKMLRQLRRDRLLLTGLWRTVRGLPPALAARRVVSARVIEMWAAVEGPPDVARS